MRYAILTTKGYFTFDDICFGRLCRLPMGLRGSLGISGDRMTDADMVQATALSSLKGSDFIAVDFPVKLNISAWRDSTGVSDTDALLDLAIKEILGVLAELPMYEGMWVYQPEYKTFRVMCDNPYDQVATLLFLIRNLAQKANARLYMEMRDRGYRPLVAAVMAHLFWLEGGYGLSSRKMVATMTTDEYNWFNPQTLTYSDMVKLLKQEEHPVWFGEKWNETEYGGYKRDDHFEQEEIHFRTDLVNTYDPFGDEDDEDAYDDECGNNGPFYRLVDVFSSPTAVFTPPLPCQSNPKNGGFILAHDEPLDKVLEQFDEFLHTNGIAK